MNPDIEAYVNGELSAEDSRAFEAQIANDPSLRQAVAEQRQLIESLHYLRLKKHVSAAVQGSKTFKARRLFYRLFAFVAMVVVILAVWFAKKSNAHDTAIPVPGDGQLPHVPALVDSLKSIDTIPSTVPDPVTTSPSNTKPAIADNGSTHQPDLEKERYRGLVEETESTYSDLVEQILKDSPPVMPKGGSFLKEEQLIENGKYDEAIGKLLNRKKSVGAANDTLKYLIAISELKSKRPSKALELLFELNEAGNSFQQDAQWATCLSYLWVGKFDSAVVTLEMLAKDQGHRYHKAAKAVLDAM